MSITVVIHTDPYFIEHRQIDLIIMFFMRENKKMLSELSNFVTIMKQATMNFLQIDDILLQ